MFIFLQMRGKVWVWTVLPETNDDQQFTKESQWEYTSVVYGMTPVSWAYTHMIWQEKPYSPTYKT